MSENKQILNTSNMKNIILFHENMPAISFNARKTTQGPEIELVKNFLNKRISQLKKNKYSYAIFIEPQIDASFPDIVIAEYDKTKFENWNNTRNSLNHSDLKIYHHILKSENVTSIEIIKKLGVSDKKLTITLERLLASELITKKANKWKSADPQKSIGVKKLISVEAKIGNFSKALSQAQINKWFASESYVLTDAKKISNQSKLLSKDAGIGIYSLNQSKINKISNSSSQSYPACFGSLLFNEWIGRRLHQRLFLRNK
ncbi:MAG: hypothetical protein KKD38_10185 [Candidatus Delongbacteria bacterium]|nr:hypothetical protein [Candidatus Delongbacteria bacterium]MCG2760361.1 hypothetical protein [Candidatus Delongbacteria bacterium]